MLNERSEIYQLLKHDKEQLYNHKYKTEKEYKQKYPFLKEVDSKAKHYNLHTKSFDRLSKFL